MVEIRHLHDATTYELPSFSFPLGPRKKLEGRTENHEYLIYDHYEFLYPWLFLWSDAERFE
ncbi:MAG: hypothetical protein K9I68_02020 [Bacteroidales bacterium]|nr:hypothetical protein [Bacteroidales bacterium]MCF8338169.1 hypothetical protein [Bacteroidales bacterium]